MCRLHSIFCPNGTHDRRVMVRELSYTAAYVSSNVPIQPVARTCIAFNGVHRVSQSLGYRVLQCVVCIPFSVPMVPTIAVTVRVLFPLRASPLSRRRGVCSPARKAIVESGRCGALVFHRVHPIKLVGFAIIYRLGTAQNLDHG